MQTVLYFVRHGEFKNPKNILAGRLSGFALSDKGIGQIKQTAKHLMNKSIEIIYSSPILRTRQSALIIKKILRLPKIHFSTLILEVKTSQDGLPRVELAKSNFDFYSDKYRKPGDETIEMIATRMNSFLKKILRKHSGKNVVVITHGDPMMILRSSLINKQLTLQSIREPEKDYVTFGEVFRVTFTRRNSHKVSRVFKPR